MVTLRKVWLRLLVLGLMVVLAEPARAAEADKLLPPDTDIVFHVNVKDLAESAVVKKHAIEQLQGLLKGNAEATAILTQANFDPFKDLHTITVGMEMPAPGAQTPEFLAVGRGSFDTARLNNLLGEAAKNMGDKIAVSEHGGLKIYEGKGDQNPVFFAFLDKGAAVMSNSKSLVEGAVDQSQGKKEGKLKKETQAVVEKADGKQTVWGAIHLPSNVKELLKANPQGAEIADKLEGVTLGVMVKDNVVSEITILTSDEKAAEQIRSLIDQAKGAIGIAAAGIPNEAVAAAVIDIANDIKVTAKGGNVILRSEVGAEMIDKIAKGVKEQK